MTRQLYLLRYTLCIIISPIITSKSTIFVFQSISLETSIRLKWYDKRISVDVPDSSKCSEDNGECYVLVNRNSTNAIWFPDIYVDKTKDLRNPVYQIAPASMKFYENHKLFYNRRINYDLSCPMQFSHYPVSIENLRFVCFRFRYGSIILRKKTPKTAQ